MTLEPLKAGLDALLDLAATGPDRLRRRDCDQDGARRYEQLTANVDGLAVSHLQTALRSLGADVMVDGAFGAGTQDALMAHIGQPDFDQARGDAEKIRNAIWEKAVPLARKGAGGVDPAKPSWEDVKGIYKHEDDGADPLAEKYEEFEAAWNEWKEAEQALPFDEDRANKALEKRIAAEAAYNAAKQDGADTPNNEQQAGAGEPSLLDRGEGYPPHFCQADPRWADRILGQKKTMQKAGCAVSCCAMVAAHYAPDAGILPARPDEADKDPRLFLDVFLDQNGGYQGDSLVWGKVADFAAQHGVGLTYQRETGLLDDQRAALDRACELLEQGIFPLLRVRYVKDHWNAPFNHFVLAIRYDGHNLYFHDPGTAYGDGTLDSLENTPLTQRHGGYRVVGLDYFERKDVV